MEIGENIMNRNLSAVEYFTYFGFAGYYFGKAGLVFAVNGRRA